MSTPRLRACGIAIVFLLTGCHSRGGERGGTGAVDGGARDAGAGDPSDPGAFLEDYGRAVCDHYERCGLKILGSELSLYGQELCHPAILEDWLARYDPLVARGRFTLDADAAARCLSALREGECIDLPANAIPCREAFVGTQPVGAECMSPLECPSDARCELGSTCPGTCVATLGSACGSELDCGLGETCLEDRCRAPLAEGASCSRDSDCMLPLRCIGEFGARTCTTKRSELEECGSSLDCIGDLHCVRDDASATFVCKRPLPTGSTCREDLDCRPEDRCSREREVCEPRAGDGDPCTMYSYCPIWSTCNGSVCAPMPDIGEACGEGVGCLYGHCEAGTCTPLPDGAECFEDWECAGYCAPAGTCAPKLTEGSPCRGAGHCGEGLECRSTDVGASCAPVCT